MIYEYQFLQSLTVTITIEILILFILIRFLFKLKKEEITNSYLFFTGFICSFATLPYLWFLLPLFLKTRMNYMIIGESSVVILETIILYYLLKISFKNCLIISFICNATSFLIGILILNL